MISGGNPPSYLTLTIGETLDIRLSKGTVEAFFRGNRVASHPRKVSSQRDPIVLPEHMTREHRRYLSYNEEEFTLWGKSVGDNTQAVVRKFLEAGKVVEQGFKSCASLMKLADRYGNERLEAACERSLNFTPTPSIRNISTILKNGQAKRCASKNNATSTKTGGGGITRGADYFSRGGNERD